jgi:hypothetical protein
MAFGLTNTPTSFQHFINNILQQHLDIFGTAYFHNILLYRDNLNNHQNPILKVLEAFSEAGLHQKPEKCKFYKQEVKYLRFIISTSRTKMDLPKFATRSEWPKL